jgi:hypothetical protein
VHLKLDRPATETVDVPMCAAYIAALAQPTDFKLTIDGRDLA